MKFGLSMFVTDFSINPVELGRETEAHGFESLFVPEHTHIPASRVSPWPGRGELPQEYWHSLDPFIALGAVASVTEKLRLGSGICLVVERDPITLAKEVTSLDFLSNGRVLFGIGGGWNRADIANHGTDPSRCWKLLRERIEAMKTIWTQDEAEYHGQFVNFDPIWQWPKPVQKPHPPIFVGGDGERTLQRVVRYGDGWLPIGGRLRTAFADHIEVLNHMASEAGRGPLPVTIFGPPADPAVIAEHAKLGVDRIVFGLPAAARDKVLPLMEQRSELARRFQ